MGHVSFRPDSSRSTRAQQAEGRARMLVQDVLDREERVRNNMASVDVDPWEMRFIVDESIVEGAIAAWREEATRARRLMRRYDIQSDYREKIRDVEKRIDALLYLAENLEEAWDAAADASKRLSAAEAANAQAFEQERRRQTDLAEQRRKKDERRKRLRRRAEHFAQDALEKTRDASGSAFRRTLAAGRRLGEEVADRIGGLDAFDGRDEGPREVRKATARDLRKEPPLPED